MIIRNVPTTNSVEPQRPTYPAVRKAAKGPLLTTSNVGTERKPTATAQGKDVKPVPVPFHKNPGRKPKG